jgi:hypothetical protein
MTRSRIETKTGINGVFRIAAVVAGLGMSALLGVTPAFSGSHNGGEGSEQHESEHRNDEGHEKHGSGKSESKFYGTVEKIPADRIGSWTVNGREIKVTSATRIKEEYGKAVNGAYIEVEGSNTGKVFTADKIEVKRAKK